MMAGRVRADRMARVGQATRGHLVPVHRSARRARHVGSLDGHARSGARRGGDHAGVRDPARHRRRAQRHGSSASRSRCSTRCRRCRRSSTWCRCSSWSSRAACPRSSRRSSMPCRWASGSRISGIRQVPEEIVEAGQVVRVALRTAAAQGAASARAADDPARREPDHHDGAVGRDHRRPDRCGGPRTGGRVRARQAADRPRRGRGRLHPAPRGRSRPYNSSDGVGAALDAGACGDGARMVVSRARDHEVGRGRQGEENG